MPPPGSGEPNRPRVTLQGAPTRSLHGLQIERPDRTQRNRDNTILHTFPPFSLSSPPSGALISSIQRKCTVLAPPGLVHDQGNNLTSRLEWIAERSALAPSLKRRATLRAAVGGDSYLGRAIVYLISHPPALLFSGRHELTEQFLQVGATLSIL